VAGNLRSDHRVVGTTSGVPSGLNQMCRKTLHGFLKREKTACFHMSANLA